MLFHLFQLLSRQLIWAFEEIESSRRHSLEFCLLLENDENYPRDGRNLDDAAQRAVQRVAQYFNYNPGFGEVAVVHKYSSWAWIVR